MTGIITDIHRSSFVDGPGIRTTIFLKGCPLRCIWCHNPETIDPVINADFGKEISVDDIVEECLKDRIYYDESGGGVTISGGEPLMQADFTAEILKRLKEEGIHTSIDTCGYGSLVNLKKLLPLTDLFLFDYKVTDPYKHEDLTGVHPQLIRDNLKYLVDGKAAITLRCPLIPGVNDDIDHLTAISDLEQAFPELESIEILPWHTMGRGKYDKIGLIIDSRLPKENVTDEKKREYTDFFMNKGNKKVN